MKYNIQQGNNSIYNFGNKQKWLLYLFSQKKQAKLSMQKVRLNILGLSVSQTQSGAYALVLAEENGERRIPIIIGPVEHRQLLSN